VFLAQLLALVAAVRPGYTALPGSLIEDISSTDVAAIVMMDSFRVEVINSLTPFGANEFLLNQLGQVYGVEPGGASNTSVFCVFAGTPGFVVSQGFTVTDGGHQYTVQDGGIVGSGGSTPPLFCLASLAGSWAVPANSVTTLVTSVPSTITLTVTNPETGIPGASAESVETYRSRVLQAGLAASQGMARYLKTLLQNVSGVQARLVSVIQQPGGGGTIICGGGDPNEVAYAIYTALFDISTLVGSELQVTGITRANPGVVSVNLDHGYTTGQVVNIAEVDPIAYNGSFTATVIDNRTFSIGVNTSAYAPYNAGGIVTPNSRNIVASVFDYPDTYLVPYVSPPQQDVAIVATWNTTATNFISPVAIAEAAGQALVDYVNSLAVGLALNVFEMQSIFQDAVADILPPQLLTRLVFSVSINGIGVLPISGTGIIEGDPQSFFLADLASVTIIQG
jgi:hypothetical protein